MLRLLQRLIATPWLMRLLGAVSGSLNPWSPEVRRDPYPAYRKLRAEGRLVRMRLFGGWVAGHYADVERVLRDPAFSTNREAAPLMAAFRRVSSARFLSRCRFTTRNSSRTGRLA